MLLLPIDMGRGDSSRKQLFKLGSGGFAGQRRLFIEHGALLARKKVYVNGRIYNYFSLLRIYFELSGQIYWVLFVQLTVVHFDLFSNVFLPSSAISIHTSTYSKYLYLIYFTLKYFIAFEQIKIKLSFFDIKEKMNFLIFRKNSEFFSL